MMCVKPPGLLLLLLLCQGLCMSRCGKAVLWSPRLCHDSQRHLATWLARHLGMLRLKDNHSRTWNKQQQQSWAAVLGWHREAEGGHTAPPACSLPDSAP